MLVHLNYENPLAEDFKVLQKIHLLLHELSMEPIRLFLRNNIPSGKFKPYEHIPEYFSNSLLTLHINDLHQQLMKPICNKLEEYLLYNE